MRAFGTFCPVALPSISECTRAMRSFWCPGSWNGAEPSRRPSSRLSFRHDGGTAPPTRGRRLCPVMLMIASCSSANGSGSFDVLDDYVEHVNAKDVDGAMELRCPMVEWKLPTGNSS